MEEKETQPQPQPLGEFYEEGAPLFEFDSNDSSLFKQKTEELLESRLSWWIRSSYPDSWMEGRKSPEIREKWWTEAKDKIGTGGMEPYFDSDVELVPEGFSEKMWELVIDGLEHYATLVDGLIQPGPLTGVTWVADGLVGGDLRERLQLWSEALEVVARKEKNWHPGTEGRVLNLIDPSLYALIPEETIILNKPFTPPRNNYGLELAHFMSTEDEGVSGSKLQWLPADVDVDPDGTARFASYVNNLNPVEYEEMYGVLEEILSTTFVPMWQKLLTHIRRERNGNRMRVVRIPI